MAIFVLTALAWIGWADLQIGAITLPGWTTLLGLTGIHDGTVAMAGALLLFAIALILKKWIFCSTWPAIGVK